MSIDVHVKKVIIERLAICGDYRPKSVGLDQGLVEGEDVRRVFGAKCMQTVNLVEQGKPIKENEYLLLSCVVDVPCTRDSFVLEVKDNTFKRIRASAVKLPLVQLRIDVMTDFFLCKQTKMIKWKADKTFVLPQDQ